MAKFYFEKDRSRNSQESRNPWSTSSTYIDVGCFGNLISLTERSGLCLAEASGKVYEYFLARVYMPGSRERISKYYVPGSPVLIKYIKSNEKRTALNFNLYPRMIEKNYREIKKHENILEKNRNWS